MTSSVSTLRQSSSPAKEQSPFLARSRSKAEGLGYPHVDRPALPQAQRINGSGAEAISFGSFRLLPRQRLLLHADAPVQLGSRALEILIALLERPGELLGKDELMARVWPNTHVVPANLVVQLTALRRALGDGRDGNRFVINIPGQGYRFVAPVAFADDTQPSVLPAANRKNEHNLPIRLTRLIGRADIVDELAGQIPQRPLLTIAGPGGIGKTAVAVAVAERMSDVYEHGVWLVELASVAKPALVASSIAAALGLDVCSENPLTALAAALRAKRMLLVLDNCEHVIGAVAEVTANILRRASGVRILATSREPLRIEGERVVRLSELKSPPASPSLTATDALGFPAVQLFVERAAASLSKFEIEDADAPVVAEICRRLDGMPLAIELAAARVAAIGLRGVAGLMDDCLKLLTGGHRTTPPRQQTIRASLDWSDGLLPGLEQSILRRLSVFAESFTLQAAARVAADSAHSEGEVINGVLTLIAKSLVMANPTGAEPRLQLLGTTRAYAREKLDRSSERDMIYRRHAECHQNAGEWKRVPPSIPVPRSTGQLKTV